MSSFNDGGLVPFVGADKNADKWCSPVSAVEHCAPVIVVTVKRSLYNLSLPFFVVAVCIILLRLLLEYRQICKVVMQKRLCKRGSVYTLFCVPSTFCSESDPVHANFFPFIPDYEFTNRPCRILFISCRPFFICSTSTLYLFIVFGFLQFSLNQFGPFAAGTQIDVPEKYLVSRNGYNSIKFQFLETFPCPPLLFCPLLVLV